MTAKQIKATGALCAAFAVGFNSTSAGSVGHYNPGVMNIRDYLVPDQAGIYGALYNYYYTSDRFNDSSGHEINSVAISPGPGPGVTLNVQPKLDVYALAPAVLWVFPWDLR